APVEQRAATRELGGAGASALHRVAARPAARDASRPETLPDAVADLPPRPRAAAPRPWRGLIAAGALVGAAAAIWWALSARTPAPGAGEIVRRAPAAQPAAARP